MIKISNVYKKLVNFLANRGLVIPATNYPFMSRTSILSAIHLKHQNMSAIYNFVGKNTWLCKFIT